MCFKNIQEDLKKLSPGPWEYSFEDGAHYVVSGCSRKTIAVFAEEKNARALVDILSNLPDAIVEQESSVSEADYDELETEYAGLEKQFDRFVKAVEKAVADVEYLE